MLERICKELGLRYDGMWLEAGGYQFTINNPKLMCSGTSVVVFDTNKTTLINKMNEIETMWINTNLKEVNSNV